MTGKNKTPLVGWHPSADLVAWLEAEVERRGGGRGERSSILDAALSAYRMSVESSRSTPVPYLDETEESAAAALKLAEVV